MLKAIAVLLVLSLGFAVAGCAMRATVNSTWGMNPSIDQKTKISISGNGRRSAEGY